MGCHLLLQGIFLTQGLNPDLSHMREDSLPSEPPGKPTEREMEALNGKRSLQSKRASCPSLTYSPPKVPIPKGSFKDVNEYIKINMKCNSSVAFLDIHI